MNAQTYGGYTSASDDTAAKPTWIGPAVVVLLIAAIYGLSRKNNDVAENPLVDLLVLTVGVLAVAHLGRWAFTSMNSPGLAKFFSLPSNSKDNC